MTGAVCLQGGGEFSPGCREMDGELLRRYPGAVAVTALAGAPGREYATANRHGVEHYGALGAADVRSVPDARQDPEGAWRALAGACVLVLPGGSPARLLEALQTTVVGRRVREVLDEGGLVVGSSAGAMVVSAWTVLPDRTGMPVVRGLGLVPGVLVVPHWTGRRADWLRAARAGTPRGTRVLGLPEESGLLVEGTTLMALGQGPTRFVLEDRDLSVGEREDLAALPAAADDLRPPDPRQPEEGPAP